MIRVYTKSRHVKKITNFLNQKEIEHKIFTVNDEISKTFETSYFDNDKFELGISYCYPRKIIEPLLSAPINGFVNYHPAPLPQYKGPTELKDAIKNKEIDWGVTVHHMDKNYDTGKIIQLKKIHLHEPRTSSSELGAVSHYFLFSLFKETIEKIINNKNSH